MTSHKKKLKLALNLIPYLIIIIPLILIIVLWVDTKSYLFWIATIIEIGLAVAYYPVRRHSYWMSYLIFFVGFLGPVILAMKITSLMPVGGSLFAFGAAFVTVQAFDKYVGRSKNKTNSIKLSSKFPFPAVFPVFLPEKLKIDDYHISKKNQQTTLELNYNNDGNVWLWIFEANGVIIRDQVTLPEQKSDKIIKGTAVTISQEILTDTPKRKILRPLYIEAAWSRNDINFNLASEGIALEEVEKIIASMIQETKT